VGLYTDGGFGLGYPRADAASLPVRASLERRLGSTTWLLLNGSFSHGSSDVPVANSDDPAAQRTLTVTANSAAALLGVRQILATGLVSVSVHAGIEVAGAWIGGQLTEPPEYIQSGLRPGIKSTLLGVTAGFAFERELVEALALRIAVDLASAARLSNKSADFRDGVRRETVERHSGFGVGVAPSLELRLYF
jgi:hypothetical protein